MNSFCTDPLPSSFIFFPTTKARSDPQNERKAKSAVVSVFSVRATSSWSSPTCAGMPDWLRIFCIVAGTSSDNSCSCCLGSRRERCREAVALIIHAILITTRDCSENTTHRAKLKTVRMIGSFLKDSNNVCGASFPPAPPEAHIPQKGGGRRFKAPPPAFLSRSGATTLPLRSAGALPRITPAWNATQSQCKITHARQNTGSRIRLSTWGRADPRADILQ
mmetsp:Transcript_65478/g.156200  ORF Transcript_65478/g.156200 Transcript_65478/m.156200 type:complete len:220 (+) Transcript_65478:846-1505(+)